MGEIKLMDVIKYEEVRIRSKNLNFLIDNFLLFLGDFL